MIHRAQMKVKVKQISCLKHNPLNISKFLKVHFNQDEKKLQLIQILQINSYPQILILEGTALLKLMKYLKMIRYINLLRRQIKEFIFQDKCQRKINQFF